MIDWDGYPVLHLQVLAILYSYKLFWHLEYKQNLSISVTEKLTLDQTRMIKDFLLQTMFQIL